MNWPTKRLYEVASINPKFVHDNADATSIVSFVPMAAVSEVDGIIVREEQRYLSQVIKGFTPFLNGDILVAKITPCFENGKIAVARLSRQVGFGSTEFHVVRPEADRLDTRYALHFLRQPNVRTAGEGRMTGSAGQRRVPKDFIENLRIPLPPLAEQQRVAAILDDADSLRRKRREAIARLDNLLQSVFLEMFGDPTNMPPRWPVFALGTVCSEIYRYPTFYGFEYQTNGTPVVRIGDILQNGVVNTDLTKYVFISHNISDKFPRTKLQLNDIVMAVRGDGSTGKRIGIVTSCRLVDAQISPNLLRFQVDSKRVLPKYLFALMTSEGGQQLIDKYITRTAKKTITARNIKEIPIPVPPIGLQDRYVKTIDTIDALRAQAELGLAALEDIFTTLQIMAFSPKPP